MSFQCAYCPFMAKHNKSLTMHTKKYHPEECRFACSQCDEKFLQKSSLDRHENLVHGDSGFSCDICMRKLCSGQALKKHIAQIHPTDGRNDCKKCHFKASNSRELRSHVDNVHEAGNSYKCEYCGFATRKPQVLVTHIKKAHGCENKCPACDKNYTSQGLYSIFINLSLFLCF